MAAAVNKNEVSYEEQEVVDAAQPQIHKGSEIAEKYSRFDDGQEEPIPHDSPARKLQHYLDSELGSQFGEDVISGKWSPRRTAAFVIFSSVFLWSMIFMGVKAIFY